MVMALNSSNSNNLDSNSNSSSSLKFLPAVLGIRLKVL